MRSTRISHKYLCYLITYYISKLQMNFTFHLEKIKNLKKYLRKIGVTF